MNITEKTYVSNAAQSLRLRNIELYESVFKRPTDFPELDDFQYSQQFKRLVQHHAVENALVVRVELGVRLIEAMPHSGETAEPAVFIEIEADYIVVYEITSEIDEQKIKAFADFNCVHNVWPFWRQHVFDIVQRGDLPTIEIPLLQGMIYQGDASGAPKTNAGGEAAAKNPKKKATTKK